VFAPRVGHLFIFQHDQASANALAGVVRQDHIVDIASLGSDKGVGKAFAVFGLFGG